MTLATLSDPRRNASIRMQAGRPRFRWSALASMLLVVAFSSNVARAQSSATPSDPRENERSTLYREGLALADDARWGEALEKFRAVVAIRSAPRALVALAMAEENTGRLASARRTYAQAEKDALTAGDEASAKSARDALAALEHRVPRVVVRVPNGVAESTVAIDGTDVPAGQELEIDPGEHLVVARAPGMTPFEERFRVGPGSRHEVVATFEPQPPTPLAPPDARRQTNDADASAKSAGGPPIGPLVLGGVGVAATAVGVALRVTGQSDYDSASEQCPEAGCPNGELADNGNSARNRMLVGTVVAGVGAAALVGAGIWWVLTPSAKNDAAARPLRFRRVAVGVGGNDETTWVGLRGVF